MFPLHPVPLPVPLRLGECGEEQDRVRDLERQVVFQERVQRPQQLDKLLAAQRVHGRVLGR